MFYGYNNNKFHSTKLYNYCITMIIYNICRSELIDILLKHLEAQQDAERIEAERLEQQQTELMASPFRVNSSHLFGSLPFLALTTIRPNIEANDNYQFGRVRNPFTSNFRGDDSGSDDRDSPLTIGDAVQTRSLNVPNELRNLSSLLASRGEDGEVRASGEDEGVALVSRSIPVILQPLQGEENTTSSIRTPQPRIFQIRPTPGEDRQSTNGYSTYRLTGHNTTEDT